MAPILLAAALLVAFATPAEAEPITAAIATFSKAFLATKLGTFLTTNIIGRLLVTVAISALRAAIARSNRPRAPGIRTANTQTGGTTPASFILGRYATEGQLAAPPMSHSVVGERVPNSMLTYVIELGDIPGQTLEGLILDGEAVTIGAGTHPNYGNEIGGRFQGKAWVRYYDGTQTVADPDLVAIYGSDPERPWTSDMVGRGLCYAILTFQFDREVFQNFPRARFVMQGIKLYDPRADSTVGGSGAQRWTDPATWSQTDNPMVMIYNILRGIEISGDRRWGGESRAADLPLAQWFAAMNACDAAVTLAGGGTEPAFRAGFEVFCEDDEPADIIDELLKACSGEIAEMGGRFIPRVGGPGLPVYFFTDADIALDDPREHYPYPLPDETYNIVTAIYPDPAALWEPREAPPREDTDAIAADGTPNTADLDLSACPYPLQVQRIMEAALREERRFARHVLSLPSDAIGLEPLDVVTWASDEFAYAGKGFEITGVVDPVLTGRPRLSLRERDAADSVWTTDDEIYNPAPSAVPAAVPIHVIKPTLDELGLDVQAAIASAQAEASEAADDAVQALFDAAEVQADLDAFSAEFVGLTAEVTDIGGVDYISGIKATSWLDPDGSGNAVTELLGQVIAPGSIATNRLTVGLGQNMLTNTGFVEGARHWSKTGTGTVSSQTVLLVREPGASLATTFNRSLALVQTGSSSDGYAEIQYRPVSADGVTAPGVPVVAGQWYEASVGIYTFQCQAQLYLAWFDAAGTFISVATSGLQVGNGGSATPVTNWRRIWALGQAPSGAAYASLWVRMWGSTGGVDPRLAIFQPQLAESHPNAEAPAPFSPAGTTLIDGGSIITGSITAAKILAGTITADRIAASTITTDRIAVAGVGRTNLAAGSASEWPQYAAVPEAFFANFATFFYLELGPHDPNEVWHHYIGFDLNNAQDSAADLQAVIARRTRNGGVWSSWNDIFTTPLVSTWTPFSFVDHFRGSYQNVALYGRIEALATPTKNNIRNLHVTGQAVVR